MGGGGGGGGVLIKLAKLIQDYLKINAAMQV